MIEPAEGRDSQAAGYYGLPLLKPPVWTWEVPTYFFVGGTAGAAALIGAAARTMGASAELVTRARWIAVAGALASPPLLISDLGRPGRFINMLRVVKPQSPMSVGAWALVVFSAAAAAAAGADAVVRKRSDPNGAERIRALGNAAEMVAASSGAVLATYTGVLIGATAVPAWSRHVALLPIHFGASSLGSATALLELLGLRERALNRIALGSAAVETLLAAALETGEHPTVLPFKEGRSGALTRAGSFLTGPVPLALRGFGGRYGKVRQLAAVMTVIGSALTRFAWVAAGRASAALTAAPPSKDPY